VNVVIAVLLAVHVGASSATFRLRTPPATVRAGYTTRPLAECGSGRSVPLHGAAHFVIHFQPAQTALSFARPRRLRGAGRLRELAKVCDFESDLAWAIGLDRRRVFHVVRSGSTVTVVFR
jgi:hypothetical protein